MRPLLVLIFLFTISLKAQISRDTCLRSSNTEYPLAFINHGNFTSLLTNPVPLNGYLPKSAGSISIHGINPDHSVKFTKKLNLNVDLGLVVFEYKNIQSIYQTDNKGLYFLISGEGCTNYTNHFVVFNGIIRTDSSGNMIFQRYYPSSTFKHIGIASPSFYFVSSTNTIQKINNLTGFQTDSVHITTGTITATAVNNKKHIAMCTNDSIIVVDTLGSLITSVPGNFNFDKIYTYKKNYVLLHKSRTQVEYRDSNLTYISGLTMPLNKKVLDVYIANDSIYIGVHNSQSNTSSIAVYDFNFNLLDQKNITNSNQTIVQLAKEGQLQLLINEHSGNTYNNSIIKHNQNIPICSSSFSTFNKLQDVYYPFDIQIKRIKNIQTTASINPSLPYHSQAAYNYTYTNHLILYNNSIDSIRSFCISHPIKEIMFNSAQICTSDQSYKTYHNYFNIKIAPNDSIELALPSMTGTKFADSPLFPVEFMYFVSLPNGKTDQNVLNSQLTYTAFPEYYTLNIYPNPTKDFINLPPLSLTSSRNPIIFNENVTIRDMLGQTLLITNDRKNINVSTLRSGVYIINFEFDGKMIDRKFVKLD